RQLYSFGFLLFECSYNQFLYVLSSLFRDLNILSIHVVAPTILHISFLSLQTFLRFICTFYSSYFIKIKLSLCHFHRKFHDSILKLSLHPQIHLVRSYYSIDNVDDAIFSKQIYIIVNDIAA
uniref:Uncharacterized protein n=1 Tax=Parascaris univalens TaxID=6257 RepID=A0A915AVD9_PARUN